ncbi:hypothetical protein LCGC14_1783650 [marine sediment metagenome]|uniref:Uncharacterized protein n=1 Tax=marine sediment metagenome TaxID=412755 RepID=A0A0F9J9J1_9ZZZZ
MNINILPGDFAIVDSSRFGAKAVKYLMRSPTIWQDFYRMATNTLEIPLHYHALMFENGDYIIEQQGKCIRRTSEKILNTNNNLIIFRIKGISQEDRQNLITVAKADLGKGYGVISCLAKFLTWTTFIPYFARYIKWDNTHICINRICKWAYQVTDELFGKKTYLESTTWSLYKYVIAHPEKFEIVYSGNPREDNLSA